MKLATRALRREDYYVTSAYGNRIHPITGKPAFHDGEDYGTNNNKWALYAIEDGEVWACGIDAQKAIFAWIKYPRLNVDVLYLHMDQCDVKVGQKVNKDTKVGNVGTTGISTGIHLHLSIRKMGTQETMNPADYDYQEEVIPTKTPSGSTYTVQPGDNLTKISKLFSTTVNELVRLNNIPNPNEINPGQVIKLPGTAEPVPTPVVTDDLKVGDKVIIIAQGNSQEGGKGDKTSTTSIGWTREIIGYEPNKEYPYKVGAGRVTTGWFKAEALKRA